MEIDQHKTSLAELYKLVEQLQKIKDEIIHVLEAQWEQIGVVNIGIMALLEGQKSTRQTTIIELNKEVARLKMSQAQDQERANVREENLLRLIDGLKNENTELRGHVRKLSDSLKCEQDKYRKRFEENLTGILKKVFQDDSVQCNPFDLPQIEDAAVQDESSQHDNEEHGVSSTVTPSVDDEESEEKSSISSVAGPHTYRRKPALHVQFHFNEDYILSKLQDHNFKLGPDILTKPKRVPLSPTPVNIYSKIVPPSSLLPSPSTPTTTMECWTNANEDLMDSPKRSINPGFKKELHIVRNYVPPTNSTFKANSRKPGSGDKGRPIGATQTTTAVTSLYDVYKLATKKPIVHFAETVEANG